MSIYGRKLINGSVECLGIPAPSCGTRMLGLKIYWFPIRVGETEVTTKLGLPQLAIDLVSTAWIAGMMNNGYNFRFEIPLVVSSAEILLVV